MAEVVNEETGEITETPGEEAEPIVLEDEEEGESNETTLDPEPEPEGLSEKDIEVLQGKLEKETHRHTSRITEIMGDDATILVPCELCEPNIPGWRWPVIAEGDAREPLYALVNGEQGTGYAEDDDAQACDRCNALGSTLTHSRVPGSELLPCGKCKAKGWTSEADRLAWDSAESAKTEAASFSQNVSQFPAQPPTSLARDTWGRTQGAPFFGMDPQFMTPEQVQGDYARTAY